MSNIAQKTSLKDQRGMVSIMVTMVLMVVIGLIVLGFAQISRRNQREVLDKQLSSQAFYAAESAVNDVQNLIKTKGPAPRKTDCKNSPSDVYYGSLNSTIDSSLNVSYSCLLVDPTPKNLQTNVDPSNSVVWRLKPAAGTLHNLNFKWTAKDPTDPTPTANCATTPIGSMPADWTCGYGMLRFDLVPTGANNLTAAQLQANTMTTFALPLKPGSTGALVSNNVNFTRGSANNLVGVPCDNTSCSLNVQNLDTLVGAPDNTEYYLRISAVYQSFNLTVTPTDSAGGAVEIIGAQVVVDATGKAQDVLRRIQVRVSASANGDSTNALPTNAISSTSGFCKRFSAANGFFSKDAAGVIAGNKNRLCQP